MTLASLGILSPIREELRILFRFSNLAKVPGKDVSLHAYEEHEESRGFRADGDSLGTVATRLSVSIVVSLDIGFG